MGKKYKSRRAELPEQAITTIHLSVKEVRLVKALLERVMGHMQWDAEFGAFCDDGNIVLAIGAENYGDLQHSLYQLSKEGI